jgi:hypothetical protein
MLDLYDLASLSSIKMSLYRKIFDKDPAYFLNKHLLIPLLAGLGSDTSDSTIELYESWKNDPNRDMNTVAVLNNNFNLNKLVPLFTKMRNSIYVYQSMLERMAHPNFLKPLWDPSDVYKSFTVVFHNLDKCPM